jgi:hypothetical protein
MNETANKRRSRTAGPDMALMTRESQNTPFKTQRFRFQNENQLKLLPQKTILGGTSEARLCF